MMMRFLDHAIEIALELGDRTGGGLIVLFAKALYLPMMFLSRAPAAGSAVQINTIRSLSARR